MDQLGQAVAVPEWSGVFWEGEDFGWIEVHVADERTPEAPDSTCWTFVRAYAIPDENAQIFEYRKVCTDCPCSLRLLDA